MKLKRFNINFDVHFTIFNSCDGKCVYITLNFTWYMALLILEEMYGVTAIIADAKCMIKGTSFLKQSPINLDKF